jgi:hypothetical protein
MSNWNGNNSPGHYTVYGLPGEYSISVYHPLYDTFSEDGINVTQWSEVTCEHANTENLIIALDKLTLKQLNGKKSSGIISQITKGHC